MCTNSGIDNNGTANLRLADGQEVTHEQDRQLSSPGRGFSTPRNYVARAPGPRRPIRDKHRWESGKRNHGKQTKIPEYFTRRIKGLSIPKLSNDSVSDSTGLAYQYNMKDNESWIGNQDWSIGDTQDRIETNSHRKVPDQESYMFQGPRLEPRRAFWDEAYILGNLKADNGANFDMNHGLTPAIRNETGISQGNSHHSGTINSRELNLKQSESNKSGGKS